ncbi:hypothetical protein ACF08M_22685 [Streptomyces sp. NPDC015032]|uniref:hypothetical protein n=1 Tax=Streptomyces sp. NPDC015032 TaxID=3364937 RepID=UPI0036F4F30B
MSEGDANERGQVPTAAVIPPSQTRLLEAARGADNLASAANVSAFNIGNAGGPLLAGAALSAGAAYTSSLWIAAALGAIGPALAMAATVRPRPAVR